MKVREFIELFEKTHIYCYSEVYSGSNVVGKENIRFDLSCMGLGCFGQTYGKTFIFEKNDNVLRSYSCLPEVKNDVEIMNMELISIPEFKIVRFFNKSSSGNLYADNSSQMRFIVR